MPFVCIFYFCSLTAEPQPVWVPGATVIPEEASLPGSWIYTIYMGKCTLGPFPLPFALPPFPAVMNLRGATAGDFPTKRPMPNIYKELFWASFRKAHKSKDMMNQALDSGNP